MQATKGILVAVALSAGLWGLWFAKGRGDHMRGTQIPPEAEAVYRFEAAHLDQLEEQLQTFEDTYAERIPALRSQVTSAPERERSALEVQLKALEDGRERNCGPIRKQIAVQRERVEAARKARYTD